MERIEMLRGESKKRLPKIWSKKQNQLRKLRDAQRERETRIGKIANKDLLSVLDREDAGRVL
jgi:hypothetical protein